MGGVQVRWGGEAEKIGRWVISQWGKTSVQTFSNLLLKTLTKRSLELIPVFHNPHHNGPMQSMPILFNWDSGQDVGAPLGVMFLWMAWHGGAVRHHLFIFFGRVWAFILTLPGWVSCNSLNINFQPLGWITTRLPYNMQPPWTLNSFFRL